MDNVSKKKMDKLPRYTAILEGKQKSKYLTCKTIPVAYGAGNNLETLWHIHDSHHDSCHKKMETPLLDLKMFIAEKIVHKCHLCERRCGTDRTKTEGECGVSHSQIASEFLHYGEEHILVPSYTIFFSGCTFRCVFCQNWDISQKICGGYIEPERLADKIEASEGINVNWVGGEPTPNLPYIFQILGYCKRNVPQVWNSNMYCSQETMKLLCDVMDVYLTDFKFGNDRCAQRLSGIDNYWKIISRNHLIAYDQGEMIIRHLVLPNHIDCCSVPILDWIGENIPGALVNIMAQYRPCYKATRYRDIDRPVSRAEFQRVVDYGKEQGLNLI